MQLPPFAALKAFAELGRQGSMRSAAQALGISHGIVSRHIKALEQMLETTLYNRDTGRLTDMGRAYHSRVSDAIAELHAATQQIRHKEINTLGIWCSAGFALHWLAKRLPAFKALRSNVVVSLHSSDVLPDFHRDDVHGDIRYVIDGAERTSSKRTRSMQLARPPIFPVAAPMLLDRLRKPVENADDLARLPLIEENDSAEWSRWLMMQGTTLPPNFSPVGRYGQAHLTLAAARSGQGIALTNRYLVEDDLVAGTLRMVDPSGDRLKEVPIGSYIFRSGDLQWEKPSAVTFRNWLKRSLQPDAVAPTTL